MRHILAMREGFPQDTYDRVMRFANFVMHVGRPILVVPTAASGVSFDSVMVGWKDTRETRRAIADARGVAAEIAGFLDAGLDVEKMAAAVDPRLHRNRV